MDTTGTYGDNNGDNIGGGNGFNLMTTVFGIVVVFCCVCDVVVGGINERDGGAWLCNHVPLMTMVQTVYWR